VIVPAATAVTIVFNVLANALRLNGYGTGEISDRFPNLFVPAGYVFAIWFIIYVGLIVYSLWQAQPAQLNNPRLQAIALPYVLSCVANIGWLICFHFFQFGASMLLMIGLLLALITCYVRLGVGQAPIATNERWFAHVPFGIYLGWITVATVANATQLLVSLGWDGFGISQEVWTVIMIAVGTVLALLMFITRRDAAYLFVLAWAFAGIGVKQAAIPPVATTAWVASALIGVLAVISLIRRPPALAAQPA
jgi:hypothetical protein